MIKTSNTTERALENLIEKSLIAGGYEYSDKDDYNSEFALDEKKFWQFLENSQKSELNKLADRHDYKRLIIERLNRKIKKDGILTILKKGLSIDDAHFNLFYDAPYNSLNPDSEKLFANNVFSIARQIHYSATDINLSIDMVLFINGLAITTFELKNPWTGQNIYHARKQYQEDRDKNEPLFQFGRCLVHFAVDTEEIFMTTKLDGKGTYFLPFNKGNNHGKGNPANLSSHKTAYLWQEILTKKSLTNIIKNFTKLVEEEDKETGKKKKILFFPRYHQLDVVRKVLDDVKDYGIGKKYLIQHSAGSGKSNSITWLAYQLVETYDKSGKSNIFDSVIIVTDRRILDKQLKENIKNFSEVKNVVAHAYNSSELKKSLENGKKIIITTIQKFPFIVDGISNLSDKKFAVIIDEAHSSQSGVASHKLNSVISSNGEQEDLLDDLQDKILESMNVRKMGNNASFFAFTATPKNATLEKFGIKKEDGKFYPFHLYSMKQAIEEGFILDVLANYTTYRSYYEIQKSIEDNPEFNTKKAQKKLRSFVESHASTIEVKSNIIIDHFVSKVWKNKMKGQAKAMVVTRDIKSAIKYFVSIRKAIKDQGLPFSVIISFTGKKTIEGVEHSEDTLNGFSGSDIPKEFKKSENKILVVANKFLTGFDEPLLHSMYVDKKLQGVLAVQTLSRLNRCNNRLGKKDTFILDFYNSVEDIKNSFDDFYTSTSLSQATDVNVLHDIKDALDSAAIYEYNTVKEFNQLFFNEADAEKLSPLIDSTASKFDQELSEEEKIDFKIKAKQFVKVYNQISCIVTFNNSDWEMLHWYLKFLIPKLKVRDKESEEIVDLLNNVDLSTYGLERVKLNYAIGLDPSESEIDPQNPNPREGYNNDEKDQLDQIIHNFNERFFSGWDVTPQEQRVKFINIAKHVMGNPSYKERFLNNSDEQNRKIALKDMIKKAVNNERRRELNLYKKYASDGEFEKSFDSVLMRILLRDPKSLENLIR